MRKDYGDVFAAAFEQMDRTGSMDLEDLLKEGVKNALRQTEYIRAAHLAPEDAIAIATKICACMSLGRHTLTSICKSFGVSREIFMRWASPHLDLVKIVRDGDTIPRYVIPEIHDMYKQAKELGTTAYLSDLREHARLGLEKRVRGMEQREERNEYKVDTRMTIFDDELGEEVPNPGFGQMILIKQQTKVSYLAPDTPAIIFTLTNVDSDNFKVKTTNVNENLNKTDPAISALSDKELDEKLRAMEDEIRAYKDKSE